MTIHLLRPSLLVRRCAGTSPLIATARPNLLRPMQQHKQLVCRSAANSSGSVSNSSSSTSLYGRYQTLLTTRPFLVQAVQAGILMGAGDFIAQTCLENRVSVRDVDYGRTFRFFALGLTFVGPTVRFWYGLLDKRLRHANPVVRTLQKVFVDQFVFAPIFMAQLVAIISFMQHRSVAKIEEKLRREYLDILVANYYVWPWVQLVNFRFVPLSYQVPLTQMVAVMWNIYISWKTNQQV